ncbi:chromate transporter [Cetobacterium sp.]|uniref:chromate transporter n=1 Tax=Cetobacterium sp. TaxID=2071632 RepID=UPI003EE5C7D9
MIYINLFVTFFKIGLFSFGGGYAMLSMISQEVVLRHKWLTMGEFTNIVAISQVTPGPIAVNSATYIGYKASGNTVLGSVMATSGVVLPSIIIMFILIKLIEKYKHLKWVENAFKGLRIVVVGLILGAAFLLMNRETLYSYSSYLILLVSLVAILKYKVGPIPIVIVSGIVGATLLK